VNSFPKIYLWSYTIDFVKKNGVALRFTRKEINGSYPDILMAIFSRGSNLGVYVIYYELGLYTASAVSSSRVKHFAVD
jgi:hypothetical protein